MKSFKRFVFKFIYCSLYKLYFEVIDRLRNSTLDYNMKYQYFIDYDRSHISVKRYACLHRGTPDEETMEI